MKRKWSRWLAVLLAACLALTACGGSSSGDQTTGQTSAEGSEQTESADLLTVAISTDPSNLKMDNITTYSGPILENVIEPLFQQNNEGVMENNLIEDYELDEDGQGVTLYLLPDLKFSDGSDVKASDFIFSLSIALSGGFASNLDYIDFDQTEAVDDSTIYMKFTQTYGPWKLGFRYILLISQTAYEATDEASFWQAPVGTGAYRVSEWSSGDHITLEANEYYRDGVANIQTINFRIISETSVAMMELRTGGVDLVYSVSNEEVNKLEETPEEGLTVFEQSGSTGHYLGINDSKEIFADKRVREALAYAIDVDELITGTFEGNAVRNTSIIGEAMLGYSETYAGENYPYQYDPEKAKELLAEAGYADGLTLSILVDDTAVRRSMAEQLYNMFAEVGITLEIEQVDYATATERLNNTTDWDLFLRAAGYASVEGLTTLKSSSVYNLCRFDVLPLDGYDHWSELISEIELTTDDEARAALYSELNDYFFSDCLYWVPLVVPTNYMIHTSSLSGFERAGDNIFWHDAVLQ
ncbi:MAG: ABC transporter substrate-binding protein [Lachnospiraceae bacterium]|nr:ABC transporter substrate-binding protein [Lachnospiraceae bacterium]